MRTIFFAIISIINIYTLLGQDKIVQLKIAEIKNETFLNNLNTILTSVENKKGEDLIYLSFYENRKSADLVFSDFYTISKLSSGVVLSKVDGKVVFIGLDYIRSDLIEITEQIESVLIKKKKNKPNGDVPYFRVEGETDNLYTRIICNFEILESFNLFLIYGVFL